MFETKQKKSMSRRESLKAGRRKSSVPHLEEIIFKELDIAEVSESSLACNRKDKKLDDEYEEDNQNWESVRGCLF